MNDLFTEFLGYIGTSLLGITMLPQIYKTFSEKKANDISLSYLILQLCTNCIFIVYGYFINSIPIIISNIIVLLCSSSLVYAKYKYKQYDLIADF